VYRLREAGHDAIHMLDLPDRNSTADATICVIAGSEDRAVITKDIDFIVGTPGTAELGTT
jgi:predicted nuclease of predicted toxin-antitoxin system